MGSSSDPTTYGVFIKADMVRTPVDPNPIEELAREGQVSGLDSFRRQRFTLGELAMPCDLGPAAVVSKPHDLREDGQWLR